MKPEHFKRIDRGSCHDCGSCLWVEDLHKHICSKHSFPVPHPAFGHVCEDYEEPRKQPERTPLIDYLGSLPTDPTLLKCPATLVMHGVWITHCDLVPIDPPMLTQGMIEVSSKNMRYKLEFQATDVLVEE